MAILLKFHGALDEVTGSCHFFKIKGSGNIYAVDCGATQGDDVKHQAANPRNLPTDCKPDMLSGILLTHAHGDHINHLPRWFKAGFKGSIYCTEETAKLAEISLQDSRRIEDSKNGRDNGFETVDEGSFLRTIDALRNATLITPGRRQTLENEVTIEAVMTSHLLGSCGFRIEASEAGATSSVFFTGDIGPVEHQDETLSLYAERQRPSVPSDYVISESTYGNRPRHKDSQSGRRRLDRVCQMLQKAFRHGEGSTVFIPAFSLQRSIDVLVDVFCALHFRRDKVGLDNHEIPLIVVHSRLSKNYGEAYRDFYYSEARDGFRLFNKDAMLHKVSREHEEVELDQMGQLLPKSGSAMITRYDANLEEIQTEVFWGGWDGNSGRPTVVICASGMTQTGPIVQYLAEHLDDPKVTFALCGYVPPNSPGGRLRAIWDLPRESRGTQAIRLPGDEARNRLPIVVPGDEIKCEFESISEYYSGHADGASIIRYILGDNLERAGATKGIFLVHGDKSARNDLMELIQSSCADKGVPCPDVMRPLQDGGWFDCGTGQGETNYLAARPAEGDAARTWEEQVSAGEAPAEWRGIVLPDRIEVETSLVVANELTIDEVMQTLAAAFDFARPEIRGHSILLKINRPRQPHSTVMLRGSRIGGSLLKLTAESRLMQVMDGSKIAEAALEWRRVLNALKAPKELYFAGARYFQTEAELDRLAASCAPVIYDGQQRLQPVLLLPNNLLLGDELEGLVRLLTPTILVAIVGEDVLPTLSSRLGLEATHSLTARTAIYLPLKAKGGAQCVTDPEGRIQLQQLTTLVTSDTWIFNAREPQLHAAGKPTTLERMAPQGLIKKVVNALVEPLKPQKVKVGAARMTLPAEAFMEHVVGQKLKAKLEHVRHKKDTDQFIFAIYRLEGTEVTGILHHTNLAGAIDETLGTELELWVRSVSPEDKNLSLTNIPMSLPADAMLGLSRSRPTLTPRDIAEVLGDSGRTATVCQAADDSFAATKKDHPPVVETTELDTPRAIDAYNRAVHALGLVGKSRTSAPAPLKGPTYGDVARELGYTLQNVIDAAGHMVGDPESYELGITVLPSGFTPKEDSPFPPEAKERFLVECRAMASRGWQPRERQAAKLAPDCHSIDSLARLLGLPQPTLLARLEAKGIKPEVRVVITPEDIRKLIG